MIIAKSNLDMSSSRSYSCTNASESRSEMNGAVSSHSMTDTYATSQNYFLTVLDNEEKNLSDTGKTNSKTTYNNGEMNLKGNYTVNNAEAKTERVSSRKARELTLLYLLQRIRDAILGNRGRHHNDVQQPDYQDYNLTANNNYNVHSLNANTWTQLDYMSYSEHEETSFSTTGQVVTADGRTLDFNVSINMTRSFSQEFMSLTQRNFSIGDLTDPLVINLDTPTASVSDMEFTFDIDSDGVKESLKSLSKGSGFLALDINNDGIINDGSELFGTKSGDGFKDLAAYDTDGNGWIDEADEVFDKLLIWSKDENGNDILYHLKDKNVGAICVDSLPTDFSLKDIKNNTTNAVVRRTGVFLYENGMTGTVQHLDMAT